MATSYNMFQSETTSIMAVVVETAITEICQFLRVVPNSYNPEREVSTELHRLTLAKVAPTFTGN